MRSQQFTIQQQYMIGDIKINTEAQLDRTYTRLLLDAFVPYQETMFTYLDELIVKHDPQLVEKQLKEVEKQTKKKSTEWMQTLDQRDQADKAEQKMLMERLQDLQNEENALYQTNMELIRKLNIETRSQTILHHKKEDIMKLLQKRQAMIEEGTWEKIGGKDKMSHVFSLLGDDSIGFGFSKITFEKRAWLAHLARIRHDEMIEHVSDVIIDLGPNEYMTVQNVQDSPITQPSPDPHVPS